MMNKCIVFLVMIALLINSCTLIPATQQEFTIAPTPAATSTETPMPVTPTHTPGYTSERFGVSFDLPSGWEKVGEDHFVGPDGFVQIEPFESIANSYPARVRLGDEPAPRALRQPPASRHHWSRAVHRTTTLQNHPLCRCCRPDLPLSSSSHPTITMSAVMPSCAMTQTSSR